MTSTLKSCKKNARHLFLIATCLFVLGGMTSCNNEDAEIEPDIALDDASLLASQMDKIIKTRASSTIVTMVTTAKTINFFDIQYDGNFHINWGDGAVEINAFSHTYTDNLPVHTIFIYGEQNSLYGIDCPSTELLFIDIAPSVNFDWLNCTNNRLTTLDVSQFQNLQSLWCDNNRLRYLDVSNNANLSVCRCEYNDLDSITFHTNLRSLSISNNNLTQINFPIASLMELISVANNNLTSFSFPSNIVYVDFQNNQIGNLIIPSGAFSRLYKLFITNNPFENVPYGNTILSILNALPDRGGLTPGILLTDPNGVNISTITGFAGNKNWQVNP